jgi:GAF domain-containing protein
VLEGDIVGVLDVQSDKIAGLDEGDAALLRSVANQVAVAIRNAQQFEQVQAALEEARVVQQQYLEGAWSRDLVTRRSVGRVQFSVGESTTLDEAAIAQARKTAQQAGALTPVTLNDGDEQTEANSPQHALVAPLKLRDVTIGSLQFHDVDLNQQWSDNEVALINAVIDQVVQTAENLRLFEQTRERASRERLIGQISDRLRRAPDFDTLLKIGVEEIANALKPAKTFVKMGSETELLQGQLPEPVEPEPETLPADDIAVVSRKQPSTNGRGDVSHE